MEYEDSYQLSMRLLVKSFGNDTLSRRLENQAQKLGREILGRPGEDLLGRQEPMIQKRT